jgi:hypothetical protein
MQQVPLRFNIPIKTPKESTVRYFGSDLSASIVTVEYGKSTGRRKLM